MCYAVRQLNLNGVRLAEVARKTGISCNQLSRFNSGVNAPEFCKSSTIDGVERFVDELIANLQKVKDARK